MDKGVLNVLVNKGSGLNILPAQTMQQLSISLTDSSPFIINMANLSPAVPLGEMKDCRISKGKEVYVVTFHVI